MRRISLIPAAVAVASLALAAAPSKKGALDKAVLETYLRHLELWSPAIAVKIDDPKPSTLPGFYEVDVHVSYQKAFKDQMYLVSKDGQKIIKGSVHDINQNPFQPDLDKLKTDLEPSFGAPGAKVVIVMFSDFECPLCKEEAKSLRANIPKDFPNDVRVYFKNYPLEAIHPWAKPAALAGRCVFRMNPVAFWQYHDWIYDHQGDINPGNLKAKVLEFAAQNKLDAGQLEKCLDTGAAEAAVDRDIAEGRSLEIDATPTMFVNGRRLVGQLQWEQSLKQIINFELDYQKTTADAGEKCCEIKIPSPLGK